MVTLPLIFTAITGFLVSEVLGGRAEGHQGRLGSIRIKVKEYTVHVHHWLYASMAMAVLPSGTAHKGVVEAFLLGVVVHGLTYRDFYKVIYKAEKIK